MKSESRRRYLDNYDRIFGEPEDKTADSDGIEVKVTCWGWHCKVCQTFVSDPENHQYHAVIKVSE